MIPRTANMFDYVIVGAGSAGCVVASRLSEDASVRVLLLEAGGPDTRREIRIPAAFSKLFRSEYDWAYFTEPQPHLNNRRLYWPRGKVLGGSSSINAMIYIRGHASDYDGWAALGNPGWSFADVLPSFKKAEDNQRGASEYHGAGGPLAVSDLRSPNVLSRAFVEAGVELGFARNPDFNGAGQEGFGFYQVTQKRGARHSAADAYLKPALARPNLTVRTGAHATQVLFEGTRAVGVAYLRDGHAEEARAGREVILCGGTVNSPQLLLLSGVGPAGQLRSLGIPVVADLRGVGENLQDHLEIVVGHQCTQPVSLDRAETLGNLLQYVLFRRGPLTSNVAESGGFVKTRPDQVGIFVPDLPAPDLQYMFGPVYYLDHGFTRPQGYGFGLVAVLLRPQSRGRITLRSTDPLAHPAIHANYLSSDADLAVLVAGVKLGRRLFAAKPFDPYRGPEARPGAQVQTDAEIADHIRRHAETIYHPVGTCKMGADSLAVVDAQLRVHGIDGLRVVDASVMPVLIGGNTNAATLMVAEKAATLIRR